MLREGGCLEATNRAYCQNVSSQIPNFKAVSVNYGQVVRSAANEAVGQDGAHGSGADDQDIAFPQLLRELSAPREFTVVPIAAREPRYWVVAAEDGMGVALP